MCMHTFMHTRVSTLKHTHTHTISHLTIPATPISMEEEQQAQREKQPVVMVPEAEP